ncbi:MAG: fibronectin type III domain-containing protein [candidate division Zixibacteria bacterium]|nr:fibronectin type III domain-containing protein [candidate division Zixibacteria bacterium]
MYPLRSAALIVVLLVLTGLPLAAQSDIPIDSAVVDSATVDSVAPFPPLPPTNLEAVDVANDAGGALSLSWTLSPDDASLVTKYLILRSSGDGAPFAIIGETTQSQNNFTDNNAGENKDFYYRVVAHGEGDVDTLKLTSQANTSAVVGPTHSTAQWFHWGRLNVLIGLIAVCAAILAYINVAKSGKELYIRKIAGIEAVEDAIGRATEMGRKIFYIPGIMDMDDMQTIASIPILGRVAEIAARNETFLDVPVSRSLVMVTAREAVRDGYARAGRPDAFNEDQVHYLTDDQFGYAAAIDGMVVREKPATIFYMGAFFAESLILAETGNAAGAIQIAGTAMPSQLPFFVTACDYTLIGEELFAASAYLSREPKLLGSLKGQDFGKGLALLAIVLGIILELLDQAYDLGIGFLRILSIE